ncbi:MAG: type II toxin-antitoxin system HigB family toxin [Balneolaceae bacterium]
MRISFIKQSNLREKSKKLTGSEDSFDDFIKKLKVADWNHPNDIKNTFSNADIIGNDRVIFDLRGNQYRVICQYKFVTDIKDSWVALYLCWIGTHEEYNKLCANSSHPTQYTVWDF